MEGLKEVGAILRTINTYSNRNRNLTASRILSKTKYK